MYHKTTSQALKVQAQGDTRCPRPINAMQKWSITIAEQMQPWEQSRTNFTNNRESNEK